jgi:trimethylamine--corrinoid protein Co-methyltransferase
VNVIKDVGPGGQYLTHNQTLEKFKEEHLIPELVNTANYEDWEKMKMKDIRDRAREKVKNILKTHTPPPLDQNLNKELNEFIKNIEKRS